MEPVLSPGTQTRGLFLGYRRLAAHARGRCRPYPARQRPQVRAHTFVDAARRLLPFGRPANPSESDRGGAYVAVASR